MAKGLFIVVALGIAGCGGAAVPSSFAGKPDVVAAEAGWCDALGKLARSRDKWGRMAECKALVPAASAAYIKGMSKCFPTRMETYGKDAPDSHQIVTDCNDEVLVAIRDVEAPGGDAVIAA